jgi:hypothetical protein
MPEPLAGKSGQTSPFGFLSLDVFAHDQPKAAIPFLI